MTTDSELRALVERLLRACETDFALREAVRTLAERLLAASPDADIKRTRRPAPLAGASDVDAEDPIEERTDLGLVAKRLRMKADGARWAAERRRRLSQDEVDFEAAIEPNDREIIRRAKEIPGCYLWTNAPNSPSPADLEVFETLAKCFENAAKATEIVHRLDEAGTPSGHPAMQRAFQLLAEAQSALRLAARDAEGPEDPDQYEIFHWLKANTRDRGIYVARHMRVNDPADPGEWADLARRLEAFSERVTENRFFEEAPFDAE